MSIHNRNRKPIQTTVDPEFAKEIRGLSDATKIPMGTLIEDAWAVAKGTANPVSIARLQMVFASKPPVKRAA